jgi:hypothetical protein
MWDFYDDYDFISFLMGGGVVLLVQLVLEAIA